MRSKRLTVGLVAFGLAASLFPADAISQRPLQLSDPFYWNESARRTFFDRYAVTGEISSRPSRTLKQQGLPWSNGLNFRMRFDSELTRWLDLGAIVDAVGTSTARTVSLKWLVFKYYRYIEEVNADYAIRLAVDPSSDGRVGFPQVDLAFLYTEPLLPILMSDFSIGFRRVNVGSLTLAPAVKSTQSVSFSTQNRTQLSGMRAIGTEIHGMMSYHLLLDPAGSSFFLNLLIEAGTYDLIETVIVSGRGGNIDSSVEFSNGGAEPVSARGGAFWTRLGVEYSRPWFLVSPFVAVPLTQWVPDNAADSWQRARFHVGLQLTVR